MNAAELDIPLTDVVEHLGILQTTLAKQRGFPPWPCRKIRSVRVTRVRMGVASAHSSSLNLASPGYLML